jgi:hypothetical protein
MRQPWAFCQSIDSYCNLSLKYKFQIKKNINNWEPPMIHSNRHTLLIQIARINQSETQNIFHKSEEKHSFIPLKNWNEYFSIKRGNM